MAHYARLLLTISSLITASFSLAAMADDNGHCLKIYADTSTELLRRSGVSSSSEAMITKVGGAGLAASSVYFAAKRQWISAGATAVIAAGVAALNYFSNNDVETLATNKQKYIIDAGGLERDATLIYMAYADVVGGDSNSEPTTKVMQDLAIDKQDESKVLAHLVDQMENGSLCENDRPKPLGKIYAELKSFDQTQVRGVY